MPETAVLVYPVKMSATDCSALINMRYYRYAQLVMPAAFDTASIYLWASPYENSLPALQMYDHDGNPLVVSSAAQGRTYEVPPEVIGCRWIGLTCDPAQSADRKIVVVLKD